jgi:hypothetical protein
MNNSLINFANPNFVANQYLPVLVFLIIAIGLSCVIILIPFIINKIPKHTHAHTFYFIDIIHKIRYQKFNETYFCVFRFIFIFEF